MSFGSPLGIPKGFNDPQYQARGLFETVEVDGRPLRVPALPPFLSETPGRSEWAGPALGQHNEPVYRDLLGLDGARLETLRDQGII